MTAKMAKQAHEVQQILETVPSLYRGPGGAVAIIREGELIAEKTWGYADLDRRVPVTSQTLMPICSISKQMVCALMMDLENNPPPELAANGPFEAQMESNLPKLISKSFIDDHGLT